MIKDLLKQHSIGKWWGGLKQVAAQLNIYYQVLVLALLLPTAYATWLAPWLHEHNRVVPFWIFAVVVVVGLTVVALFEFRFSLPSVFSFWNDQWYRHDNPLRRDLEEINDKLANELHEVKEKLARVEKAVGCDV